jgi:hypothetical protein
LDGQVKSSPAPRGRLFTKPLFAYINPKDINIQEVSWDSPAPCGKGLLLPLKKGGGERFKNDTSNRGPKLMQFPQFRGLSYNNPNPKFFWTPVFIGVTAFNEAIKTDDLVKSRKYSLSLDGRGRGKGDQPTNPSLLLFPSPSSPSMREREISYFLRDDQGFPLPFFSGIRFIEREKRGFLGKCPSPEPIRRKSEPSLLNSLPKGNR